MSLLRVLDMANFLEQLAAEAGRKYIPELFEAFKPLPEIEHVALFVFGSGKQHPTVGGGRVLMIKD